jgi:UDPglucose 6-dehydrogenase
MNTASSVGPTAFVGLSHLGITYAAAWAAAGGQVVAVDPEPGLAARLALGDLPVREPGLAELLSSCRERLTFTETFASVADCPLVVICRDVPTDDRGISDLWPIRNLVDSVVPYLRPESVLVVMSQVPPGFTRALGALIQDLRPDLSFELYYWVETLIFGDAVRRATRPERVIVGCVDPAAPLAPALAQGAARFDCPILPMVYESAELAKTAINLFLVSSVTCSNALADLCERIGADWSEIVPALRLDARIGPAAYLRPGLGVAGGNLERDLATLQQLFHQSGGDGAYVDSLLDLNRRRLGWVHRLLDEQVFSVKRVPTIAVWGLTYKKNTRSTKNSPSLQAIQSLVGRAQVRAWDPAVGAEVVGPNVEVVPDRDAALDGADCLLIMTDWDEFAAADLDAIRQRSRRSLVIDCVGVLDARRDELAGIEYLAMGLGIVERPKLAAIGVGV